MERLYYIGLDIHKKTISYCVKQVDGKIVQQGAMAAERKTLLKWMEGFARALVGRYGSHPIYRLGVLLPQALCR